ncbi:peptidoglycan bridge formation glycyltransferase FemA/FemB family protein [Streptomyces atratus]|nr:peptidoglycan bridge formation glycyltransferase FemA/FemB family protein [Streptomyces atratus]
MRARVGEHAWYSYGASATAEREVCGPNAVQRKMITDALAAGCTVHDLRGITGAVDDNFLHLGLIQFKVGTGGEALEYLGEWDLPLNRLLCKAFDVSISHRGRGGLSVAELGGRDAKWAWKQRPA